MKRSTLVLFAIVVVAASALSYWLGSQSAGPAPESAPGGATTYYCSMHPDVRMPNPGACPKCGMDLVELPKGAGPRAIELTESELRLAEVETKPVERRFVESTVSMVGKVAFDETQVRTITARVAGRLDRMYVDYTGVPVAKGDHLVDLYSPGPLRSAANSVRVDQVRRTRRRRRIRVLPRVGAQHSRRRAEETQSPGPHGGVRSPISRRRTRRAITSWFPRHSRASWSKSSQMRATT